MVNPDNILQFVKSIENLSFLMNSASCEIKVKSYILIVAEIMQNEIL